MTTAHRPTFDPARGKDAQRGPAYHQRLLPAHKTLKFRQQTQGGENETKGRDFRAELLRAERKALAEKEGRDYESEEEVEEDIPDASAKSTKALTDGRARKRSFNEADGGKAIDGGQEGEESYEAKKARVLAETAGIDASSDDGSGAEDNSDDSSDDDDDDEDEFALLQAEMAKIKRERAEAAAREAAEKAKLEEDQRVEDIARGNPLLNPARADEYGVKRRWDDDVVFKNQARGTSEREKGKGKEFVNDLLRSDFHRKFMSRYVR